MRAERNDASDSSCFPQIEIDRNEFKFALPRAEMPELLGMLLEEKKLVS